METGKKYKVLEFKKYGDECGNLVVAEGSGFDVPFDIRRVFYMYGSDHDVKRRKTDDQTVLYIVDILHQIGK